MSMERGKALEPCAVREEDLTDINRFARTPLKAEEVYCFALRLCDNEVDRDYERFDGGTLAELGDLFVGKTGVFDHQWSAEGQRARIYRTEIVSEPEIKTQAGDGYCWLKAWAYLLRTERNAELIREIEGGITQEVSVGCAVAGSYCSVCGADRRENPCGHHPGKKYGGVLCYTLLDNPTDAYEWSFVAVPAQPAAGVTKSRSVRRALCLTPERALAEMEKGELHLDAVSAAGLRRHIALLERQSEEAGRYRRSLCEEIRRSALLAQPELEPALLEKGMTALSVGELETLGQLMRRQAERRFAPTVQTAPPPQDPGNDNSPFCI